MRDFRVGQCGATENQSQMKPNSESGIQSRQLDGLSGGALIDHQAAAREYTFTMRQDDGSVHRFRIPKIVTGDY